MPRPWKRSSRTLDADFRARPLPPRGATAAPEIQLRHAVAETAAALHIGARAATAAKHVEHVKHVVHVRAAREKRSREQLKKHVDSDRICAPSCQRAWSVNSTRMGSQSCVTRLHRRKTRKLRCAQLRMRLSDKRKLRCEQLRKRLSAKRKKRKGSGIVLGHVRRTLSSIEVPALHGAYKLLFL